MTMTHAEIRWVKQKRIRVCLNPPPKSTGTNRMDYYLPDELVQKTSNRFHAAREKQFTRKRKNMCLTTVSASAGPNGPTERA